MLTLPENRITETAERPKVSCDTVPAWPREPSSKTESEHLIIFFISSVCWTLAFLDKTFSYDKSCSFKVVFIRGFEVLFL